MLIWLFGIVFVVLILYINRIVVEDSEDKGVYCYEVWEFLFNSSKVSKEYILVFFGFLYVGLFIIIIMLYLVIFVEFW